MPNLPATAPKFIHLTSHTSFSLLEAVPSSKALAAAAAKQNMPAFGITETNNLFSLMQIGGAFPKAGVQPIVGVQLGIERDGTDKFGHRLPPHSLTFLIQNRTGYMHMADLLTKAYLENAHGENAGGEPFVALEDVLSRAEGLICLTGNARQSPVVQHILDKDTEAAKALLTKLHGAFGDRLYIEVQRHGFNEEQIAEPELLKLASALSLPLVATNDVRFIEKSGYEAFDVLVCIGDTATLDRADRKRFSPEHYFKTEAQMCTLFADIPSALANTVQIAKRCAFLLEQVDVKEMHMPRWPTQAGESVADMLTEAARTGLAHKIKLMGEKAETIDKAEYDKRLQDELDIIIQMGFDGYFLITADFIQWSKQNDIPVGPGRGSGAGSLVAWVMEITDLDPIEWDLYFERFLNPERISLPDFDIDFCQDRRDEVIKYVREKYGHDSVSQIITFGTLKARACIRDVGRVLQMPYGQVGQIASFIPPIPNPPSINEVMEEDEKLAQLYDEDEDVKKLLDVAMQLEGCYRHASTHAAGVHIADRPIHHIAPLYLDPRAEMPATALEWVDSENAGLVKFDFLGLKTLSIIHKAIQYVRENKGLELNALEFPLDDPATFDMLRAGHTVGVFQIESAGMTDLLKRAIPQRFTDLSDVIALFRPGPLASGMVDDFLDCRLGKKEPNYPHPTLEPILKETFGVPVYQEQIMMMARVMAGYTLGGADNLRRAMGKKKPAEMAKHREIFVKGAGELHDVPADDANSIFDLMANFAGYGFNKAHTMAYGLIAYQTAYLKANHPFEFIAASMTYDRGNTPKLLRYKQELQRMGSELLIPDINHSHLMFVVEDERNVRFALAAIKGAGEEAMRRIVSEREANGAYKDLFDFLGRHAPDTLGRRQLEVLIKAGALDSLYDNRAELFANIDLLAGFVASSYTDRTSDQTSLFGGETVKIEPPKLAVTRIWTAFEQLEYEQQVIGFYLSSHPLEVFGEELSQVGDLKPIAALGAMAEAGRKSVKVCGIILASREMKTKKGDKMGFVTLSDTSGQEELVLFPDGYAQYAELLSDKSPMVGDLKISVDGERLRLLIETLRPLEKISKGPASLLLKVADMNALSLLKETLDARETGSGNVVQRGKTVCDIIVPSAGSGEIKMRLSNQMRCDRHLLASLETVPGLEIVAQA